MLRRYYSQAKELSVLAGPNGIIQVNGCNQTEPLLTILGYRIRGQCGNSAMTLLTADPQRAFLTIDSGFPLLDLEESLQKGAPFVYAYHGSSVPTMFALADWTSLTKANGRSYTDLVESILYEPDVARLYWALSQIDPETRAALRKDVGLEKLLPLAPALDLYGSQFCIRAGAVAVPGGAKTEKEWQSLVGASPGTSAEFIPQLLKKIEDGWRPYYDAMSRASQEATRTFRCGSADEALLRSIPIPSNFCRMRQPGLRVPARHRRSWCL